MSEQTREDLKNAFLSGQTLTEQKMHDLLDSLLHKSEDSGRTTASDSAVTIITNEPYNWTIDE